MKNDYEKCWTKWNNLDVYWWQVIEWVHAGTNYEWMHIGAILRVRTFEHQTFQIYHVYSNFLIGYICRITVNFGALKDESL